MTNTSLTGSSELAWTHAEVMLRQLNATEQEAQLFGSLASSVIYANPSRRAGQNVLLKNKRGQSGLWGYGISGDIPIVLVRIQRRDRISLIKEMVQAHAYWRMKGLIVDLVIWNEDPSGYRQELQDEIMRQIPQGADSSLLNRNGGIFIRRLEQMSDEDRILIQTVARADYFRPWRYACRADGTCQAGMKFPSRPCSPPGNRTLNQTPVPVRRAKDFSFSMVPVDFLRMAKSMSSSRENGTVTPAPWVNVLANENFGTVISENGSSYTWSENAHEFRLTPWMNDPVLDLSGEALYIRDEETGIFWSPARMACPRSTPVRDPAWVWVFCI